ncbi:putative phosphonate metabolism protein (plasmid) [Variovorax sp. SRS16]|uniref:DUF1045 domain-containing protein n=1 Tax=Variovorax sp. SRS16 TaxID=282217 RepID=UPI0013185C08|nr:DUF1045 domain-containing protein [Variovorax sp. SRS16]VTU46723.1 putative phosphonate metabolism protein [Variovorax sp. SRS16]
MRDNHRYAAYFAPAVDDAWWRAGSRWLGRDAAQRHALPQPPVPGLADAVQARLTQAPRRYGWHATLKAPFRLAPGVDAGALRERMRALAAGFEPFTLPPLEVCRLDDFLALVPRPMNPAIDAIAAACVKGLQPLAAALPPAELARRRAAGLTPLEDALLLRWGYPFVLERFRFHLSLTGALGDTEPSITEALERTASAWFGDMPACRFQSIALFAEAQPGADFVLIEHFQLGA